MFGRLKIFLIIYLSGVAFMVRLCDISFCQRGVTTTVQKHSIPKGRYEERHPATLRGEPPSRVKVLERMRVRCLGKPRSADYSSGPKESLKTRVEDLRIARHPADSQLATK